MIVDVRKNVRNNTARTNIRLINENASEGFKEVFDYQKYMLNRILWVSQPTELRIVPGNDGTDIFKQVINNTNWTSDSVKTEFLSDTFYMTQTLQSFGDNKIDVCSNLDPNSEEADMYPESPLNYFANTIHRVMRSVNNGKKTKVKYKDSWKMWTGMRGKLPFPKQTLLFQAIVHKCNGSICSKGEDYNNEPGPLYGLIGINHTASINALLSALVDPMNRRKPIGVDNNNYGSLAEVEGNMLFLNPVQDSKDKLYLEPSIQSADASQNDWEPTVYDLTPEGCMKLWVPWNKLLRYLTVQEQLELIAREFGADTLNYVFSLSPEWEDLQIPERIKSVGLGQYGETKDAVRASCPSYKAPKFMKNTTAPVKEEIEDSSDEDEDEEPQIYQSPSVQKNRNIDMNAMRENMRKIAEARQRPAVPKTASDLMDAVDDTDLSDIDDDDLSDIGL